MGEIKKNSKMWQEIQFSYKDCKHGTLNNLKKQNDEEKNSLHLKKKIHKKIHAQNAIQQVEMRVLINRMN